MNPLANNSRRLVNLFFKVWMGMDPPRPQLRRRCLQQDQGQTLLQPKTLGFKWVCFYIQSHTIGSLQPGCSSFFSKKWFLCLIFFPVVVKCPDKSNFKKKDLIMTKDSKLQSITAGKSKQQVMGADCLVASTAKKQNVCMLVLSVFFLLYSIQNSPPRETSHHNYDGSSHIN